MARRARESKRRASVTVSATAYTALREFWRRMAESFFGDEIGEMDEGTFFEIATTAGLMEETKYDPKKHTDRLVGHADMEPGDTVWFTTRLGAELRKSRRAPPGGAEDGR